IVMPARQHECRIVLLIWPTRVVFFTFFASRRRHTRLVSDRSSDVCSSDLLDPAFLEKLDHFLAAMARRYDGNPNVAFIDIGSFGMWGEGHTGFSSRLDEEQTLAVTRKHIDPHVKHFKQTLLCISDDVAGPSKPGRHFPTM